jgi:hypothetical protein
VARTRRELGCLYDAALLGQIVAFFAGFLGAVHSLAKGSATRAAFVVVAAVCVIAACSMVRRAIDRRARASITERVTDSVLGSLSWADEDWWVATVNVEGRSLGFKIGGDTRPAPELLAHARDIVRSYGAFREKVRAFLDREAGKQDHLADEARALEIEDVCLFWPDRPNDGMIYFRGDGREDGRVWRCDYVNREPIGLGFDS